MYQARNSEFDEVFSFEPHEIIQILKKGCSVKTTCVLTHTSPETANAAISSIEKQIGYCDNRSIKATFLFSFQHENDFWEVCVPLPEDDE
uniref:Transcriptional regulator n=1 Tax=Panagrellus redivivus TaxID=6233 RepID=A0A7E4W5E4_PANRE